MQLNVLVDNNTLIDRYFTAEPGLSFYLQTQGKRILFDAGYSDAMVRNAQKMDINLRRLDSIVLSHSHLDHTWGLTHLMQLYSEAAFEQQPVSRPELFAHPDIFLSRYADDCSEIGSLLSHDIIERFCSISLSAEPKWLTERLVFLGEIPRANDFECMEPVGKVRGPDGMSDCYVRDDTALAYISEKGLVVITGCAHAGICNTVRRAQEVCNVEHMHDIIGGFHLLNPSQEQLYGTLRFLKELRPDLVHACHCTDLRSKIRLAEVVDLREVGVGLQSEY